MNERPTLEQFKSAKRYCWRMYSHHAWFCGCVYDTDEEKRIVGVQILTDPNYKDRYTYVTEHDGVRIRNVDWNEVKLFKSRTVPMKECSLFGIRMHKPFTHHLNGCCSSPRRTWEMSKPTLQDITAKRRFGWFAVKQDLSPTMVWAKSLKQGNHYASFTWQAGPKVGSFTDRFFKRNWQLPWQIGTNASKYSQERTEPLFIQLVGVATAGEASSYAMRTLQQHCNDSEQGTWKIFLVDAYSYLTEGLNHSPHVRCTVKVGKP